ncbi:MAG: HDOD domain-containing protein [Gammaproteobacteria bacterium]
MAEQQDLQTACFQFVSTLAQDLSRDDFDLPGYPAVVIELQRALGDAETSVQDVVKLINGEPALAARLVKLANSAAFSHNHREVCEPRAAVTQLGFNVVRSTASAFAVKQMKHQDWLKPVIPQLEQINRRSISVASICAGVGLHIDGVRPDEALATGLFHQIGNLYLLTRAHQEDLVAGNPEWEPISDDWHPTIARAIIESWGMSEGVGIAAENQNVLLGDGDVEGLSVLGRILAAAKLYNLVREPEQHTLDREQVEIALGKTLINGVTFVDLAARHQEDIDTFRNSISG